MDIGIFSTVKHSDEREFKVFGVMTVVQIRTEEEAEFYGSYPILCRSENFDILVDCTEDELEIVDN